MRRPAAAAVVLSVALSVAVPGCAHGDPGGKDPGDAKASTGATAARISPTPTPTRSYPLSGEPRTIPSVREHQPARGPGWRPVSGRAVVIAKGSAALADEARLLAGELKAAYRGENAPRAGDVELALDTAQKGGAEAYTLTTRDGRVRISGSGEAGVFYGTRTLKQALASGGIVPEGVVRDAPAKPQRGLMVDIARKHFSAEWIEDRLRDMADIKMNQLGLHFSDDQAFRIESDSHPEVVSPQHLTKAEVRRIVALASSLHIQVVPEIDSPGHLGAVIAAHPGLQLRNVQGTATRGAVDIANPESAKIVDELLREYAGLFPGAYWHLGADEYQALVVRDPEASFPQLAAEARRKYGANATVQDLATGWLNDRAAVVRPTGKELRAWNDGFFRGGSVAADKDLQVAYWTGKEIGARPPLEYLQEGRKVLNYNDEYLYYVLGEPNEFVYPTGRRIYEEWTPLVLRGSTPVPARYDGQILGGSFAVWCDLAGRQTQAEVASGIHMPLRATSEKLWVAGEPTASWDDFSALARKLDDGS
ncbi:beta-N-acetylhexosaminidase [Streptomyces sp. SP18CS02]|uniref:beta-N-acetylhexosaminidase n=1 Tax=Streptomyces sp. SP18CS02 TaxID=3002531 RepID=UPI002E75C2B0|nr:glycoside hydrolase family 20 protein [Streptomyces sp. SP18CS02]MEE1756174.1 glycoside hydrolase family 20 protein [Streptomyces sp. SP18CS02]